jgi:hypothetical protein
MAYNFPNSPSNGDTVTISNVTYTYNSTSGAWKTTAAGGASGASVTSSDTAPSSPSAGDLWYDTTTLRLYVYYNDGSSSQWVKANPSGSSGALVQETAPSNPGSGNLWFDPSSLETYVYYNDGDSNQWVQTNPSGSASGTTVYSSIDDLPLSEVETGAQAFVSSTNRLYLWNGTGWYNIALINTTPSISGASSAYILADDGTATTVTITATDDEGIPITYSIASDTSGNIATVTQGTGANTNVFTITPSTSTANAGTFSLTFRASDGVNIGTAVSEFTLQFQIANSHYTTALITATDNGYTSNKVFRDSSGNNHTITANGDATQNTFSPYRHGGYSIYCDGANVIDLGFSTLNSGNWTFECWALIETGEAIVGKYGGGNQLEAFGVSNTTGYMYTHTNVGVETPTCNTDLRDGKWHYLVWERYNGTYYYWADGSLEASFSNSETPGATGNWLLGGVASSRFKGNIKEARFSLSTAVYSGNAPTTPTEPQTTSNATDAFFTGVGLEIKDYSSNNRTFTVPNTFEAAPTSPYDYTEYSAIINGGSAYFDGTGDYLSVTNDTSLTIGTGDFTAECWIFVEPGASLTNYWRSCFALQGDGNATAGSIGLYMDNGGDGYPAGSPAIIANGNSYRLQSNADMRGRWTHLALARESSTMRFFVNGTLADSTTDNINYNATGPTTLGVSSLGNSNYWLGHIADARFVKGTAVYTSAFTPPTAPLTAITNTSLLLPFDDATIIDKSQTSKTLTLAGNTTISATQTKHLNYSMYLDGTGDYIDIMPASSEFFDFGTADFTIEFWMYLTNVSGEKILLESRAGHTDAGLLIMLNTGVMKNLTSGAVRTTGGTTIAADTWYHVAVVRDSTSFRTYLNGTEESGSASYTSAITAPDSKFRLGARFDGANPPAGYFSDVRITKGLARYTANFTAPTEALKG